MPWASHCCPHILTVLMTTIKQPSLLRLWVSQKILVLYLYQYGFRYTKLQAFPKEVKQTCQIKKFDLYKFRFMIGPYKMCNITFSFMLKKMRKSHLLCPSDRQTSSLFLPLLQKAPSICAHFFSHRLLCLNNFGSSSNLYQ